MFENEINEKKYSLEVQDDGIYLYLIEQIDDGDPLSNKMSALAIQKDQVNKKQDKKTLLEKITLVSSSYSLIFAIVDAIVNRSLQRNFSFEKDQYAKHLRIIFYLLVPQLDMRQGFKYDQTNYALISRKIINNEHGFMAIKRLLDSDKKNESIKKNFLKIDRLASLDKMLLDALEKYHSDDSDEEAEQSDIEEEIMPSNFLYSLDSHPADRRQHISEDIRDFNNFLQKREPSTQHLSIVDGKIQLPDKTLSFDFCIPGFRGVNHMPLRFSQAARHLYRSQEFQEKRARLPYYSEAVQMSQFDFYRNPEDIKKYLVDDKERPHRKILDENAAQLENNLLATRNEDYILVKGLANGDNTDVRLFSNYLHFLQHLYSNGIIKAQRFLRECIQKEISLNLPNAYNPFVSESEAPEHGLRYGFGRKSLYQLAALHPHYNREGKPSFPYIGEIHLSIRGMDVFTGPRERHQLRKLEKMYRVNPKMMIGPEIESTGFAWLPEGEVVHSEVIKCPNFKGHWKHLYYEKFGLTRAVFHLFKQRFSLAANKIERLQIESELINHLIQHHSVRLLQKAVAFAQQKGKILIFLDSAGQLSFKLPVRDMSQDADADAKKIRELLERSLHKKLADLCTLENNVQLTAHKMSVYRISAETFDAFIQSNIDSSTECDTFFADEEKLRTPLNQSASPRTPSLSGSSRPYSYSGSPGTPLSYPSLLFRDGTAQQGVSNSSAIPTVSLLGTELVSSGEQKPSSASLDLSFTAASAATADELEEGIDRQNLSLS